MGNPRDLSVGSPQLMKNKEKDLKNMHQKHNWYTEPTQEPAPSVLAQARLHEHGCTGTGTCDEHINTIPYKNFSNDSFQKFVSVANNAFANDSRKER